MTIDSGDTAWMLISTALVFIMIPAVGFFYGGMLRKQDMLSILGQTDHYPGDGNPHMGNCRILFGIWIERQSVSGEPRLADAERGRTRPIKRSLRTHHSGHPVHDVPRDVCHHYGGTHHWRNRREDETEGHGNILGHLDFLGLYTGGTLGLEGGFLAQLGALDFAGGTVVHITAGISVLSAVLILGKRVSASNGGLEVPHNIPFVVLGGALLWIGWFGFNGGSAIGANGLAAQALVTTQISAATAAVIWGLIVGFM